MEIDCVMTKSQMCTQPWNGTNYNFSLFHSQKYKKLFDFVCSSGEKALKMNSIISFYPNLNL